MANLKLSIDQLKDNLDPAKIHVPLPWIATGVKEINIIKRPKDFNEPQAPQAAPTTKDHFCKISYWQRASLSICW